MSEPQPLPGAVTISVLEAGDLEVVERIERASFGSPWPRSSFEAALAQTHCLNLAARCAGNLVGYLVAILHPPTILIANVAVDRGFRRHQVGTQLLEYLFDQARSVGCDYSVLDVRPSNEGAIRLYEAIGFRPVGQRPGYYLDPPEDALTMARLL